jgi:ketosteroid isomerase-like protein
MRDRKICAHGRVRFLLCLPAVLIGPIAGATDACSNTAIVTAAEVSVSDGGSFRTQSFFQSREAAAIRHIDESERVIAVEGPFSWRRSGQDTGLGGPELAGFALGHQFHAFLWYFDELVDDLETDVDVPWAGTTVKGKRGRDPYGGSVTLIDPVGDRPVLLIENPDSGLIVVRYGDWREEGGRHVPYLVSIDDGDRVFDYRFSSVETGDRKPSWFFDAVASPSIDEIDVFRLHRKLLAAHCLGDAALMAGLSAPTTTVASRGEVHTVTREQVEQQFTSLFERVDYTAYRDLIPPDIEISASGDLGWIVVNVRANGLDIESGEPFDDQWAWVMTVRKVAGEWRQAGNASNYREN